MHVNDLKPIAEELSHVIDRVKWFHGVEVKYNEPSPLSVVKPFYCTLSAEQMKAFRLTSSTRSSEVRKRIEPHLRIYPHATKPRFLEISIGENELEKSFLVGLRGDCDEEYLNTICYTLKNVLKFDVMTYQNARAEEVEQNGFYRDFV